MTFRFIKLSALYSASALLLTACVSAGYTPAEQEMANTMTGSKYQPSTREARDGIETQDLFAQAAFWSREYQLNPGDLESAIKLASAVRKMGNPGKAIEITQTSRALYPRDPYLTAEYAAALIADERAVEAMDPLDTALRTTPGYARLWSLKGAALDQVENYDLARKHYARALEITPHDPNIMANVGLSFALQGDPRMAESWLRRAASVPGASSNVHQNLALVLQLQGKNEEAERYASQHIPKARTSAPALPQSGYQPSSSAPPQMRPQANYRAQHPQASLQAYESGRPGAPKTASDAARQAAMNRSRTSASVPGYPVPGQQSVLDRIAKNVGPQPAEHSARPQQYAPQPVQNPQSGYAPQGYPQQQAYPQQNTPPQRRAPARSRG